MRRTVASENERVAVQAKRRRDLRRADGWRYLSFKAVDDGSRRLVRSVGAEVSHGIGQELVKRRRVSLSPASPSLGRGSNAANDLKKDVARCIVHDIAARRTAEWESLRAVIDDARDVLERPPRSDQSLIAA